MADCPYVDQEKSGPSNGWYCSVVGEAVDSGFYSNYCCSSVSCEYCPHIGGDDRLRNPDCLTEEICGCILNSVKTSLEYLDQYLCDSIARILEQAAETGYEYLGRCIVQSADRQISSPDLSGSIVPLVLTEPEKERARKLEQNLTQLFSQIQPVKYLRYLACSDYPYLNSSDFTTLKQEIDNYGNSAYGAISKNPINAGGIAKYEKPVMDAERSLGSEVYSYFKSMDDGVDNAAWTFEGGCSSAFSGIGNSRGYTGEPVIWTK